MDICVLDMRRITSLEFGNCRCGPCTALLGIASMGDASPVTATTSNHRGFSTTACTDKMAHLARLGALTDELVELITSVTSQVSLFPLLHVRDMFLRRHDQQLDQSICSADALKKQRKIVWITWTGWLSETRGSYFSSLCSDNSQPRKWNF